MPYLYMGAGTERSEVKGWDGGPGGVIYWIGTGTELGGVT